MISLLLVLLYISHLSHITAEEICCCPDLNINLTCSDTETSQLETNGFRCAALSNSTVTLQCAVEDVDHAAIQSTRYLFYKAYELSYKPVMFESSFLKLDCSEDSSSCAIDNVMWSDASFSTQKFQTYHNFLYQCLVEFTLIDGTLLNLTSNTMWLDVLYNTETPSTEVNETEKDPLNTNNPYERLLCDLPSTNPATKAVWYRKNETADESEWLEIYIPSEPRMALVEDNIADESSGSFVVGTLVIMIFDPVDDAGLYRCNATYTPPGAIGESTEYTVAQYKITGDGQTYSGTPEVKMISAITSDDFTTVDGFVDFTCYARDTDAEDEGLYQWVFENATTVNYEAVDTTSSVFDGVEILNYDRTLRLPSNYSFYDQKFKCNVTRNSLTKMSDQFMQPVIVPQTMSPPSTYKSCGNTGDNFQFYTNQQYMMSDLTVDVYDPVQKLPGASYQWFINGKKMTVFSNPAPGKQNETYLNVTDAIYQSEYDGNSSQKCIYFSFLQTHSSEYQLIEVLKLTKLNSSVANCSDLDQGFCDQINVTCATTSTNKILTVSLGSTNSQCLSVDIVRESETLATKAFSKTAASCGTRALQQTFSESDLQGEISGNYTVQITPEGKAGCTTTFDSDALCATDDDSDDGSTQPTYNCPKYEEPLPVSVSKPCNVSAQDLVKNNITTSSDNCYNIGDKQICVGLQALDVTTVTLSHDSHYNVSYTVEIAGSGVTYRYNCTNLIRVICEDDHGTTDAVTGEEVGLAIYVIILIAAGSVVLMTALVFGGAGLVLHVQEKRRQTAATKVFKNQETAGARINEDVPEEDFVMTRMEAVRGTPPAEAEPDDHEWDEPAPPPEHPEPQQGEPTSSSVQQEAPVQEAPVQEAPVPGQPSAADITDYNTEW